MYFSEIIKIELIRESIKDIVREFDITSSRTKWQLCQILCVPTVLFIAQVCKMPRAMWAGIAAMSAIVPFMEDMQYRVRKRIIGNIAGVICFVALYYLLPPSIYAYIGIIRRNRSWIFSKIWMAGSI